RISKGNPGVTGADGHPGKASDLSTALGSGRNAEPVAESQIWPAAVPCARFGESRTGSAVGGLDLQRPFAAALPEASRVCLKVQGILDFNGRTRDEYGSDHRKSRLSGMGLC